MSVDLHETPDDSNDTLAKKRRVPVQSRSRDRVMRLLDAAAGIVVDAGVESLSTRGIAERAGVPVASLYQYFADKDEILLALVERDIAEMDAQVSADLGKLKLLTVRSIVETTMDAFVKVYLQRPAFVMIWLRGRTNQAIRDYGRQHNRRVAAELHKFAVDAGLLKDKTSGLLAELAVEMGDRCFQLAFENTMTGDSRILAEAKDLVSSYLEKHATPLGLEGLPV
jgi:AcrR family transcriptional regulator